MSTIKELLYQQQQAEEEELYQTYLAWAEESKELWQQLATTKEWLQEEVIGYEK